MTQLSSITKFYLKVSLTLMILTLAHPNQPSRSSVEALWWFSEVTGKSLATTDQATEAAPPPAQSAAIQASDTPAVQQTTQTAIDESQGFTIAGIRPSGIASILNTVSETGFQYFNVHDQCRSRTACDVGYMLYKKLNFVHNWLIRTSVRTLVDPNNVYALSWSSGMMGKNCTLVYPACNQSPIESFMNFALLAA